jgi:hypothetical protein
VGTHPKSDRFIIVCLCKDFSDSLAKVACNTLPYD